MRPVLWAPGLVILSACSIFDPAEDTFSKAEADAFAEQLGTAFANGMDAAAAGDASAAAAGDVLAMPVNVSVQRRTNCTAGGHIEVSGDLSGNIDDTGSGVLFLQVLETISDWRCVGDRVINGDPYVSAAGHFNFLNGSQSSTATITFGGGFKWGAESSQGCQLTLTMLLRPDHTGSLSGVVCGHSVYATF